MSKPLIKSLFIFLTLVLISIGCKKYENDNRRYLKTACGRIAKKWQLYKITNRNGIDYAQDTSSYYLYDNTGQVISSEKFTYYGMILEFDKVGSEICAEVGLRGSVGCLNKKFNSGYYELRNRRTAIILDLIPLAGNPARYFEGGYNIFKMTKDEFVFGDGQARAYFKVAD